MTTEKKKYQISSLDYAQNYLERLFEIEDYIDTHLNKKITAIVEDIVDEKLKHYHKPNY